MQEFDVRDFTADWVVVNLPKDHPNASSAYFMVWVSEQPPSAQLVSAIGQLGKTPRAIVGVDLQVRMEPSLGIVLMPIKGWNFEEGNTLQSVIDKTKWEINRLLGA